MNKEIFRWEMIGALFIIIVGSFFHFLFELSGENLIIAGIVAVNESVWEHLKLGYWPLVLYSIIAFIFIKEEGKNIGVAKLLASLTFIATILVIFYSYTSIIGEDILVIDILSFVLGVIFGQIISYTIKTSSEFPKWINKTSWILFIGIGILFIVFTFYPPKIPLFQDGLTGEYGII